MRQKKNPKNFSTKLKLKSFRISFVHSFARIKLRRRRRRRRRPNKQCPCVTTTNHSHPLAPLNVISLLYHCGLMFVGFFWSLLRFVYAWLIKPQTKLAAFNCLYQSWDFATKK